MINLLWSGGRDSTYRLCYLLLVEQREVQTHYIINVERKSLHHELKAMDAIKQKIRELHEVGALLRDTIFYMRGDIEKNKEMAEMNQGILMEIHIGYMYEYLARYARQFNLTSLELCIDASPPLTIHDLVINDLTEELVMKQEPRNPNLLMFKNFRFPVIHLTKQDMNLDAEKHDFLEIMNYAWYCMEPDGDKPCGKCRSCKSAIL